MPKSIISAYKRFQETLVVRNAVAGGLGKPYEKVTSIPQGCPFSMAIVAFIMRRWIMMIRQKNVIPRVLADDILLMSTGGWPTGKFIEAFDATHMYLQDMGASLATEKSLTFFPLVNTHAKP